IGRRGEEVAAVELGLGETVGFIRDVLAPHARRTWFGLWFVRTIDKIDADNPAEPLTAALYSSSAVLTHSEAAFRVTLAYAPSPGGRPAPAPLAGLTTWKEVAGMDATGSGGRRLFGSHSNYFFDRNAGERQRLVNQFHLLCEDFDRWFDEALRISGLSTESGRAAWSALDLGCG